MTTQNNKLTRVFPPGILLSLLASFCLAAFAQDSVTGAFEGFITDNLTGDPIRQASIQIINQETGIAIPKVTDSRGQFYQGRLTPGVYQIRVSAQGYRPREIVQRLFITRTGEVIPIPISLDPLSAVGGLTASLTPPAANQDDSVSDIRARINTTDAQRGGSYTEREISVLPLGSTTSVRSFDELALLLPGVALAPQTLGSVAGPGMGAGVGSAGQFAVNGLRSRANNFTVDGSDNNDEDIGVRRQGFVALTPQPIESVREYQVITLLAPAQFGRNLGAQVNAVSASGGSRTHGTIYGFFNSSQVNARNFFDSTGPNESFPLLSADRRPVLFDGGPITLRRAIGGEDSYTFFQSGLTLGGPVKDEGLFYFISGEGQKINASEETNFVVPTVEQRGAFGSGASGIFVDPLSGTATTAVPSSRSGSDIFNLFPFPNNPSGVYGQNTFSQVLPASGRGLVVSGKLDGNFRVAGRQQSVTERYNFTDDYRYIPKTGGAIFSSLKPRVRTHNSSFFVNSEVTGPNSETPIFNQMRLSYGRTRLDFGEVRDQEFLIPSAKFPSTPFLLNTFLRRNTTEPDGAGSPNTKAVIYSSDPAVKTVEEELGAIGQVVVAGFSPLGVDVFNFPQRRVNNTYQVADVLTWRPGKHSFDFGADVRRSELNSDLPRNSLPAVTFGGSPRLVFENGGFRPSSPDAPNRVIRPEDLVALGAASNFFLTLNTAGADSKISLRYYQLNFFAQDAWRVRRNFSLSAGIRYEYNTPVRELNRRIEDTFRSVSLNLAPPLRQFIDGRTKIYEPDRNNIAPRLGLAYAPDLFGNNRLSVFRVGYGMFYDQILGSVVSQSRNVFPTFLTLNFGGINASGFENVLTFFNPAATFIGLVPGRSAPLLSPSSVNNLNRAVPLDLLLDFLNSDFPGAVGVTLPTRRLETPAAHHYNFTFEQQLNARTTVSAGYVGTAGRHLLRFGTPNLGPALTIVPTRFEPLFDGELTVPRSFGRVLSPTRPIGGIGAVNLFETSATSAYNSLQVFVQSRANNALDLRAGYTFSRATDDVSDVFDLAGASALPQNSLSLAGEGGPANFDARHRFGYSLVYDLPELRGRAALTRTLLGRWRAASVGQFQTGQPFTVNSIFDVNLDGNLTDRLNTTEGLTLTGDRRRPLALTADNPLTLLAPVGQDGRVGRNTFRAGNFLELDLTLSKKFAINDRQNFALRVDIFNFINRANFGVPVRQLEAPNFGGATHTITPGRRIQFALKYSF